MVEDISGHTVSLRSWCKGCLGKDDVESQSQLIIPVEHVLTILFSRVMGDLRRHPTTRPSFFIDWMKTLILDLSRRGWSLRVVEASLRFLVGEVGVVVSEVKTLETGRVYSRTLHVWHLSTKDLEVKRLGRLSSLPDIRTHKFFHRSRRREKDLLRSTYVIRPLVEDLGVSSLCSQFAYFYRFSVKFRVYN